ncbi:hypothetical protein [Francisella tularensis]|nr:hypothetical protein [Francisella tularensis]UZW94698.1 hypothetical protein NF101_08545 [Francisella tularensis subsp. holarctica]
MMAFLLDIITFLQISFSTNIFRINYNFIFCIFNYKRCMKLQILLPS